MSVLESKRMETNMAAVFHKKNLSSTDSRRKILSLFLSSKDALAHGDIEKKAGEKFDRVTIYRTLQVFVEKGIVHAIPTSENAVRYALCKDCAEDHHSDDHVHFVCTNCNTTICLDDVVSPSVELPKGFIANNVQVVINGICEKCNG